MFAYFSTNVCFSSWKITARSPTPCFSCSYSAVCNILSCQCFPHVWPAVFTRCTSPYPQAPHISPSFVERHFRNLLHPTFSHLGEPWTPKLWPLQCSASSGHRQLPKRALRQEVSAFGTAAFGKLPQLFIDFSSFEPVSIAKSLSLIGNFFLVFLPAFFSPPR